MKYLKIKELTQDGYELTLKALAGELTDGRYELSNGAYAFITSYQTKLIEDGLYEAHKDYTDIQLILSGKEIIGVMPLEEMYKGECVKPYEYDIELYRVSGGKFYELGVGDYLVLTPLDAHMPGVSNEVVPMRKLVIKVPINQK